VQRCEASKEESDVSKSSDSHARGASESGGAKTAGAAQKFMGANEPQRKDNVFGGKPVADSKLGGNTRVDVGFISFG